MPRCDVCQKVTRLDGGVMTYKHREDRMGFTCGDCIAEIDFDRTMKEGRGKSRDKGRSKSREIRISIMLEEESKEREFVEVENG